MTLRCPLTRVVRILQGKVLFRDDCPLRRRLRRPSLGRSRRHSGVGQDPLSGTLPSPLPVTTHITPVPTGAVLPRPPGPRRGSPRSPKSLSHPRPSPPRAPMSPPTKYSGLILLTTGQGIGSLLRTTFGNFPCFHLLPLRNICHQTLITPYYPTLSRPIVLSTEPTLQTYSTFGRDRRSLSRH